MKLKHLFLSLVAIIFLSAFAKIGTLTTKQADNTAQDEKVVKGAVEEFFIGFHEQDSLKIKQVVHPNVMMQSIGRNQMGDLELSKQDFSGFLKSICSIPSGTKFEERIHSYEIKMDGKMANVWTPYSFYINGNLSHCGTNSFQLFKRNGVWKIFYIVDTRDKEDCREMRG